MGPGNRADAALRGLFSCEARERKAARLPAFWIPHHHDICRQALLAPSGTCNVAGIGPFLAVIRAASFERGRSGLVQKTGAKFTVESAELVLHHTSQVTLGHRHRSPQKHLESALLSSGPCTVWDRSCLLFWLCSWRHMLSPCRNRRSSFVRRGFRGRWAGLGLRCCQLRARQAYRENCNYKS